MAALFSKRAIPVAGHSHGTRFAVSQRPGERPQAFSAQYTTDLWVTNAKINLYHLHQLARGGADVSGRMSFVGRLSPLPGRAVFSGGIVPRRRRRWPACRRDRRGPLGMDLRTPVASAAFHRRVGAL